MILMVLKVYRSKNKEIIIKHINRLLTCSSEFIEKIANFEYVQTWSKYKLEDIIKEFTIRQENNNEYGVKEKKVALYYTDLQRACIENEGYLDAIAYSIAVQIVDQLDVYKDARYFIVGQSGGNNILARRVAAILGLRFVIVGSLAGKDDVVFGKYYPSEKAILVDDILFTGAMLTENLRILYEKNIICENIAVALVRSLAYQEHLARFSIETKCKIKVLAVKTYLDDDLEKVLGG